MTTRTRRNHPPAAIRIAIVLALVHVLAAVPACTETSEAAKVEKDGKGKVTIDTVVDKAMTEGLVAMMQGMGYGGVGGDPTAQLDPELLKKRLEDVEGIEVLSGTRTVDEDAGKIRMKVEIAFDSLEALYSSGALLGVGAKLEKLEDGSYRFTRSFLTENLPQAGDEEGQAMVEGFVMMLEPYLKGMEFRASLEVPTRILETSGEKVSDTLVRWTVGTQDLARAKKRVQTVVFAGEGLDWAPFSVEAADLLRQLAPPAVPTGPVTPPEDADEDEGEEDGEEE